MCRYSENRKANLSTEEKVEIGISVVQRSIADLTASFLTSSDVWSANRSLLTSK